MEGVLVTARRAGSPFTVTVVSDGQGRYSFPRKNLEPGQYTLWIRAVGYDLDEPRTVVVTPQETATTDLKLHKARDLASQLTSAEWLNSVPGTQEQKIALLGCASCHTLARVVRSHHNAEEWMSVYQRMAGYDPEASTLRAQKAGGPPNFVPTEKLKKLAEYMSTINLSAVDKWAYPLKTLPRPTGRATHVIITEYDLSRKDALPHDVAVDAQGKVWWADSGWMYLGKLDPVTGKAVEYPMPVFSPDQPLGTVDVEFDKVGNVWLGLMEQGSKIAKFDPKTLKFTYWDLPKDDNPKLGIAPRVAFLMPFNDDVDGKVWATDVSSRVYRLDSRSGHVDTFDVFQRMPGGPQGHLIYQVAADSQNNGYFLEWVGGGVGRVDAKTGEVTFYPTPTRFSFSRRGHMDQQDRLWFSEFFADRIAMFDTRTNRFQEWKVPAPWTAPYDVAPDKNGDIWASGLSSDRVQRFDPKTSQFIEYLLPRYTDARRISFDDSAVGVRLWVPNKNSASAVKIEPLD